MVDFSKDLIKKFLIETNNIDTSDFEVNNIRLDRGNVMFEIIRKTDIGTDISMSYISLIDIIGWSLCQIDKR